MHEIDEKAAGNNDGKVEYGLDKLDVDGNLQYGKDTIEEPDNDAKQEKGMDFYPNEEENEEEKKSRDLRNFRRHINDRDFEVMNDAHKMVPHGLPVAPNL